MTRKASDVVSKWVKATRKSVDAKCVRIIRELFTLVIERTPVSEPKWGHSGRLVGNWQTTLNGFNYSLQNQYSPNRSGPLRRMQAVVKLGTFVNGDAFITLCNGTHYAYRAEALGWPLDGVNHEGWYWSGRVGPYRMVGLSILDITKKYGV